jgi:Methyltransferase domain
MPPHAVDRIQRWLTVVGSDPSDAEPNGQLDRFLEHCSTLKNPRVLELGTKQSIPGRSTIRREWVPNAQSFLGTDIESGVDVDIVADVHRLADVVGDEAFDVIISCSTFEHLKYPSLAAHSVMRSLSVGGCLFVQTHQTFELHGYPDDYFRFSREALESLFGTTMGFRVCEAGYEFPVRLFSRSMEHRPPAFVNTTLWGTKEEPTPLTYAYELP